MQVSLKGMSMKMRMLLRKLFYYIVRRAKTGLSITLAEWDYDWAGAVSLLNLLSFFDQITTSCSCSLSSHYMLYICSCISCTKVQVINYEIVVNFFFISAITWHDIQQLSINLLEFTLFVQLLNCQNDLCKFV